MAWVYWVSGTTSSTSTTSGYANTTTSDHYYSTSPNYTWKSWQTCTVTQCDITTSTNSFTVWGEWVDGTLHVYKDNSTWSNWVITNDECQVGQVNYEQPRPPTEEERQRYAEEQRHMEELARERAEKGKKIEEKSLQLLEENLTEDQRAVFKETGVIPVQCQSGRKYHIRKGTSANVHELDEKGGTKRRLCFHPSDCPVYDVMLAQKLMLEICEEEALRVANFS